MSDKKLKEKDNTKNKAKEIKDKEKEMETEKTEEVLDKKAPKKTKAVLTKEIKENVSREMANSTRKDRNRAEKAALREAKENRKIAYTDEQNRARLSNAVLAILIFGVIFLMFASVWGYNYFKKDSSIESYLTLNGGFAAYQNIELDTNRTVALSADGNEMHILIKDTSKDKEKRIKYYSTDEGKEEMQFVASYFLAIIRPDVRGFSASAVCTASVVGETAGSIEVDYKQVDDILKTRGMTADDLYNMQKQQEEQAMNEAQNSGETAE